MLLGVAVRQRYLNSNMLNSHKHTANNLGLSILFIFVYIFIYIILCLLKHDKCKVSMLAVTIKIQYLCVLKVRQIKTAKQVKKKEEGKNALRSSQRYKYTVQIYFIPKKKRVQIKMQQNRDINAFLKSGRCGVFFLREHFGSTTLRLLIRDQYILVRPYNIKTHYTKFIQPGLYLRIECYIYIIAYILQI